MIRTRCTLLTCAIAGRTPRRGVLTKNAVGADRGPSNVTELARGAQLAILGRRRPGVDRELAGSAGCARGLGRGCFCPAVLAGSAGCARGLGRGCCCPAVLAGSAWNRICWIISSCPYSNATRAIRSCGAIHTIPISPISSSTPCAVLPSVTSIPTRTISFTPSLHQSHPPVRRRCHEEDQQWKEEPHRHHHRDDGSDSNKSIFFLVSLLCVLVVQTSCVRR